MVFDDRALCATWARTSLNGRANWLNRLIGHGDCQCIETQVARSLELDTGGIWCMLLASFPQELKLQTIEDNRVKSDIRGALVYGNSSSSPFFRHKATQELFAMIISLLFLQINSVQCENEILYFSTRKTAF